MNRCEIHGLATGPDDQCVLCRRDEAPTPAPRSWALSLALAFLVVGVGTAAAWSWRHRAPAVDASVEAEPRLQSADAISPVAEPVAISPRPRPPRAIPIAPSIATAPSATPAVSVGQAPADAAKKSGEDAELSRADRERKEELAAAIRSVPITMYSTTWCPVCTKARAYLQGRGIAFVELDVEASDDARRAQRALNPKGGVPTLDIDGEVLVGFWAEGIQAAIRKSAERRTRY